MPYYLYLSEGDSNKLLLRFSQKNNLAFQQTIWIFRCIHCLASPYLAQYGPNFNIIRNLKHWDLGSGMSPRLVFCWSRERIEQYWGDGILGAWYLPRLSSTEFNKSNMKIKISSYLLYSPYLMKPSAIECIERFSTV